MPSYKPGREVGDKLGPKLIQLISETMIATKKGLLGAEHKVKVKAAQDIIDRAGHEIAELYEPFLREALDTGVFSPQVHEFLSKAASGEHQWQAVAAFAVGSSGLPSVFSQIMSNELAPIGYNLISLNPRLIPDLGSLVGMEARGNITYQRGESAAGELGFGPGWWQALTESAKSFGDVSFTQELLRRGLIDHTTADLLSHRQGIESRLWPWINELSRTLLSPADGALAVLKGVVSELDGEGIATQAGLTAHDFAILKGNIGEPPGTQDLLEAYRRGFVDRSRLEHGIRQSRVRNEWIDVIEALRFHPMTAADAIQASVQGYLPKEQAKRIAEENGLLPEHFEPSWDTAGEPLSRTEMTELWNRGFATKDQFDAALRQSRLKDEYIPLAEHLRHRPMTVADALEAAVQGHLSVEDAQRITAENGLDPSQFEPMLRTVGEPLSKLEVLSLLRRGKMTRDQVETALKESRLKDKYIPFALDLAVRLPALYEIRQMLKAGTIDIKEAARILAEDGYQESIINAIIKSSEPGAVVKVKDETVAVVIRLFQEKALTYNEANQELQHLGLKPHAAELTLHAANLAEEMRQRDASISRVRSAYLARRIDETRAAGDLDALGIPAGQRDRILHDWDVARSTEHKTLTAGQIVEAWAFSLYDVNSEIRNRDLAIDALKGLGYSADDAMTLLAIKNKGPLVMSGA